MTTKEELFTSSRPVEPEEQGNPENNRPEPPMVHPALVQMAEAFAADVRAGRWNTFGILCIGPNGEIQLPMVGPRIGDLYATAGIMQLTIAGAMMNAGKKNNGPIG